MMQQPYDPWGNDPQDTTRATPYPNHHTDTLVPAVSQAVTRSQNSPKLPSLKGWGRQALIAGGILGGFWVLSSVLSLSSRESSSIPQAIELSPIAPVDELINEPPPLSDLSSRRNVAWQEVQQACGVELVAIANETDTELSLARRDSWQLHSKQQCDKDLNCKSPYSWLQQQLDHRGAKIQQNAPADRLSTKAQDALEFRQAQADLVDIARALSSGISPRAMSWVPADRLSDAIDACSNAARRFESLTRATIEEATALPEGGLNDEF
jgi:hypothetical protein